MLLTKRASSIARYVLCIAGHGTEHVDCAKSLHSDEGRRVEFTTLTAGDEHRNLWSGRRVRQILQRSCMSRGAACRDVAVGHTGAH